jgi:DNA-binding NtrC family response regulator
MRLAAHFLAHYAARYGKLAQGFSAPAVAYLQSHAWPGNVRELEHWVESAVVLADGAWAGSSGSAGPDAASDVAAKDPIDSLVLPMGLSLEQVAQRYVQATLHALGDNRSAAAKRLGIGRSTLQRMLGPQTESPAESCATRKR